MTQDEKRDDYLAKRQELSQAVDELKAEIRAALQPVHRALSALLGGNHGKD